MPRINISISKEHLALIDRQAKREGRSRSAHIVELAKKEENMRNDGK